MPIVIFQGVGIAWRGIRAENEGMRFSRRHTRNAVCNFVIVLFCCIAITAPALFAAQRGDRRDEKPRRARPPKWPQDVLDTFFEDPREALVGERPDYGAGKKDANDSAEIASKQTNGKPEIDASALRWSELISANTIEDEIKRTQKRLANHVNTPAAFKGGGFEECRRNFATLAVLFAIAAEYDADVRWRRDAAGLRDLFARAGFNCKVGSDGAFNEARLRAQDLEELIRGGRVDVTDAEAIAEWTKVTDRPPIMVAMEDAFEKRLDPALANAREFNRNRDDIAHEAELLAAYAAIIGSEGYEYTDDDDFVAYAKSLKSAAREIVDATALKNYDAARDAAGRISKSCSECHEGYRS